VPLAVGVKVTVITQLAAAGPMRGPTHVLVWEKFGGLFWVKVMPVIESEDALVFFTVTI